MSQKPLNSKLKGCSLNYLCQDTFIDEKITVGKKLCTCDVTFVVSGNSVDLEASSAGCDKKCKGQMGWWQLGGSRTTPNVYTFGMKVKKGKADIQWATVKLGK